MENRTTVFYVDDNPKSSRLLSSVLEECGFRVITKNDPIEALALCKRTYFDVALLDYEMPQMSGSKLAQEIKYLVPDVPVVLISCLLYTSPLSARHGNTFPHRANPAGPRASGGGGHNRDVCAQSRSCRGRMD